jgi:hypothetical protein
MPEQAIRLFREVMMVVVVVSVMCMGRKVVQDESYTSRIELKFIFLDR